MKEPTDFTDPSAATNLTGDNDPPADNVVDNGDPSPRPYETDN